MGFTSPFNTKSMKTKFFIILFLTGYIAGNAQDTLSNQKDLSNRVKELYSKASFSTFGNGSISNMISNVSLSSTFSKGENAKIELRYTNKSWTTFGITAEQKIGNEDNRALFDLENFNSGTTIRLNFQKAFWNPKLPKASFDYFQDVKESYFKRHPETDKRQITYMDIYKDGTEEEKQAIAKIHLKQPIFFNIKYSFSKVKYNYATDSVSLASISSEYILPSVTASLGIPVLKNNLNSFLAFNYNYSMYYVEGDYINFISKFGNTPNSYSQNLTFGAPEQKSDNKINMEWRINFNVMHVNGSKVSQPANLGLSPSITYGIDSRRLAMYLPIYFIKGLSADGKIQGLQGGIRLGYVTDTQRNWYAFKDGFIAQIIVTVPFEVFK